MHAVARVRHDVDRRRAVLLRVGDQLVDCQRQVVSPLAIPGALREVVHRGTHGRDLTGVIPDGGLDVSGVGDHGGSRTLRPIRDSMSVNRSR